MRKVGPELDVMDNEKGLDGSRPITEAIVTRKGGDVTPRGGKGDGSVARSAVERGPDPAQAGGGRRPMESV